MVFVQVEIIIISQLDLLLMLWAGITVYLVDKLPRTELPTKRRQVLYHVRFVTR